MRRVILAAAAAASLLSIASPGWAQLQPASPTPCSALPARPGGAEADFRCSFPSGWVQPFAGQAHLIVSPWTFDGVGWARARVQFENGALYRIDLTWRGDFTAIDGLLRSRRGAPQDSGWSGQVFLTYPDIGDGWQVTLTGPSGGTEYSVTYLDRRRLWT